MLPTNTDTTAGFSLTELATAIGIATTILALWFSYLAYRSQRQKEADSWMDTFRDLYREFWWNDVIAQVRAWVACDAGYDEVRDILRARADRKEVRREDYAALEAIDRFCSLLVQIIDLNPGKRRPEQLKTYQQLYDRYWLRRVVERTELKDYIDEYWPSLSTVLPTSSDPSTPATSP